MSTGEDQKADVTGPAKLRAWKFLPVRSLFGVLGLYLLLMAAALFVSEHWRLNFKHPQWRMKQLGVLYEDAARNGSDVVYLGTSRMMAGIIPREVEKAFRELEPAQTLQGHNLGVELCDWTMVYSLLSRFLATAKSGPRIVVVEVGMIDANSKQHRLIRNVTRPQDVLAFAHEWTLLQRAELMLSVLGRGPQDLVGALFCNSGNRDTVLETRGWVLQSSAVPVSVFNKEAVMALPLELVLKQRARMNMNNAEVFAMPTRFIDKISSLCRQRGIRLVLLHVPMFKEPRLSQSRFDYLRTQGELLEPDYPSLYRPEHFHEATHLNEAGAIELSQEVGRWLAGRRWPTVEEWLERSSR